MVENTVTFLFVSCINVRKVTASSSLHTDLIFSVVSVSCFKAELSLRDTENKNISYKCSVSLKTIITRFHSFNLWSLWCRLVLRQVWAASFWILSLFIWLMFCKSLHVPTLWLHVKSTKTLLVSLWNEIMLKKKMDKTLFSERKHQNTSSFCQLKEICQIIQIFF